MIKKFWRHLRARLTEPVLADRRIDVCATFSWLAIGFWGVFAALSELTTVARVTGADYNVPWGFSIGILALIAAVAAFSTLFGSNVTWRIRKKSVELFTISLMAGLVSVYPIFKFIAMFQEHFSTESVATFALSAYFLLFPTWRIFHLTDRIRGLRKIAHE